MILSVRSGVEPWQVLQALVNSARPLGMGWMDRNANSFMTDELAQEWCRAPTQYGRTAINVDYVWGRPIKVNLDELPDIEVQFYDRDHGEGAAETALMNANLLKER